MIRAQAEGGRIAFDNEYASLCERVGFWLSRKDKITKVVLYLFAAHVSNQAPVADTTAKCFKIGQLPPLGAYNVSDCLSSPPDFNKVVKMTHFTGTVRDSMRFERCQIWAPLGTY